MELSYGSSATPSWNKGGLDDENHGNLKLAYMRAASPLNISLAQM